MKSNENYENYEIRLRMMKNNENDGELSCGALQFLLLKVIALDKQ